MRSTLLTAAALAALAAVPAAPASAVAPSHVATVNSLYLPGDVKVVAGGTLTLVNGEAIAHDLVSSDVENGLPKFWSRIVSGAGDSAPVTGVSSLAPGWHPYYCSLHESMRGTIQVVPE